MPPLSPRPGGLGVLSAFATPGGFACPAYSYGLQRAIPSARGSVTSPSPHRSAGGCRNLDRLSFGCAFRLSLRPRLTLIRLALIRNPWSCGVGGSRPHCRYLFPHLLFRNLQPSSRAAFGGAGMLPYRTCQKQVPTASAAGLCPSIIHAGPLD